MSDPLSGPEQHAPEPEPAGFQIDEQLAQAILNYLVTRPYGEVFGLIQGLQTLKPGD